MSTKSSLQNDPRSLAAKVLLDKLLKTNERIKKIEKLSDKQLALELIAKVWATENMYSEEFDLLEETIERLKSIPKRLYLVGVIFCVFGLLIGIYIGRML